MILFALAGLCLLTVPLTGGSISALARLRLRCLWFAPLALAIQVLIITVAPQGSHALHATVHVGTYVLIGVFLLANIRIPGAAMIAAGALANALAIIVNAGVMPASAIAERLAGLTERGGFANSAAVAHPHLLWLGDVIPIPGPLPNTLSIGDVLIFAGMLVLLHRTCKTSGEIVLRPIPAGAPAAPLTRLS